MPCVCRHTSQYQVSRWRGVSMNDDICLCNWQNWSSCSSSCAGSLAALHLQIWPCSTQTSGWHQPWWTYDNVSELNRVSILLLLDSMNPQNHSRLLNTHACLDITIYASVSGSVCSGSVGQPGVPRNDHDKKWTCVSFWRTRLYVLAKAPVALVLSVHTSWVQLNVQHLHLPKSISCLWIWTWISYEYIMNIIWI